MSSSTSRWFYTPRQWGWITLLGMIIGMAYDYLHVWGRVLYYNSPHIAGTSLWVLPEFGLISVVAIFGINTLAKKFPFPPITLARTLVDALLLAIVHLAAGYFAGEGKGDNSAAFWVIAPIAVLSVLSRPCKLVLICSLVIAIVAPLGEMLVSQSGFFAYYHGQPIVPSWLPFTWIVGVGLVIDATVLFNRMATGNQGSSQIQNQSNWSVIR